ncbi:MAG: amino acid transport protein [Planctomycetes bacterium]|nr:amino acid transport protein [Planctomycetota bacterium]
MDLTPASLFTGLITSSIGCGLFLYGKKQARAPQLVAGIVLMALPFFVPDALLQAGLAVVILLATRWACRTI